MKNLGRVLLGIIAIITGGMLGHMLLSDFEPFKMIIFGVACEMLGVVFYQMDKVIFKR